MAPRGSWTSTCQMFIRLTHVLVFDELGLRILISGSSKIFTGRYVPAICNIQVDKGSRLDEANSRVDGQFRATPTTTPSILLTPVMSRTSTVLRALTASSEPLRL